jgi:hypothetical protein
MELRNVTVSVEEFDMEMECSLTYQIIEMISNAVTRPADLIKLIKPIDLLYGV